MNSLQTGSNPETPIGAPDGACSAEFQALFEGMVRQPLPDRIVQLAVALQEALDRGELPAANRRHS